MLTLKEISWDNCFSYADDNHLRLDENSLTQLIGPNGAGKTSIALLIQEILYGKNNKNIKKQEISNNKTDKKGYHINLKFNKDGKDYEVDLDRGSSLNFKLFCEGEDISSHTTLNTYKTLNQIIGIDDFKVFCQLIYQHSTDSLDFLTATDTNRKKFLISLLQLNRYMELHEHFKDKVRRINAEVSTIEGSLDTIESWIDKHKDMDFIKQNPVEVPEIPDSLFSDIKKIEDDISNINSINRKIELNKQYKKDLEALDSAYYLSSPPMPPPVSSQDLATEIKVLENKQGEHQSKINKLMKLEGQCFSCLQEVDETIKENMINNEVVKRDKIKKEISVLWNRKTKAREIEAEINQYKRQRAEFERLSQLIDDSIPAQTLDLNELKSEIEKKKSKLNKIRVERNNALGENEKIAAHNSKVDVVKNQLDEMKEECREKNIKLAEKEGLASILDLLKKTFSTNGLVSYKIESSVKELEKKINKYLAELTHFQIYFKLNGEKLNIEVVDDVGNVTSIANLSSGERARVNIATILAIRNILSSLTSTKINLLFLDEVIGVIDAEGKEKLAEILLKENLNTFIVSHDWDHPLIPKVNIIKEHNISRIEV